MDRTYLIIAAARAGLTIKDHWNHTAKCYRRAHPAVTQRPREELDRFRPRKELFVGTSVVRLAYAYSLGGWVETAHHELNTHAHFHFHWMVEE